MCEPPLVASHKFCGRWREATYQGLGNSHFDSESRTSVVLYPCWYEASQPFSFICPHETHLPSRLKEFVVYRISCDHRKLNNGSVLVCPCSNRRQHRLTGPPVQPLWWKDHAMHYQHWLTTVLCRRCMDWGDMWLWQLLQERQ